MKKLLVPLFALLTLGPIPSQSQAPPALKGEQRDQGQKPWAANIEELTVKNDNFRSVEWTGKYLQMTLMSIPPGGEIGWEQHENEQFIRIEQGSARVLMGSVKESPTFTQDAADDWAILIPAGIWHNVINTGETAMKLYSLYSPPEHAPGEVHATMAEAKAAHQHH